MGLSSVYSGPGGQQVREQQGGYDYNPPAASGGSSMGGSSMGSTAQIFQTLFSNLGALSGNPLLGLGLNLAGNLYTNMQNRRSQNAANRLNYQMQQEQNAWNERMWHINNEYNTPANQMKRLLAAGLNPDLMYGNPSQGTSAAPAQGTTPSHAEAFQSLGFGDMFSNAQQLMMQKKANDAQIKLMNSQAEQMDTETQLKKKDLGTYDKRFELVKQAAEDSSKKIMSEIEVNKQSILESCSRISELAAREKLTLEQAATEVVNRAFLQESFQDRLEQIRLQNKLTKAEIAKANKLVKLIAEQILTEQARQLNLTEDTNLKNIHGLATLQQMNIDMSYLKAKIESEFGGFMGVDEDGNIGPSGQSFSGLYNFSHAVGAILSSFIPLLGSIKVGGK